MESCCSRTFIFIAGLLCCFLMVATNFMSFSRKLLDNTPTLMSFTWQQKLLPPPIKVHQKNYSIITGAFPNFNNQTMYMNKDGNPVNVPNGMGYIFQLVISTAVWRRLNFNIIVAITVDYKNISPKALLLMKYVDAKLKSLNATVVYFDVPSNMKVRLAQALRITVGQLHFVNNNDVLFTDDADMWPIRTERYVIPAGKTIYVANALCCGTFGHPGLPGSYREYPMSTIGMFAHTWRAVYGKLIDGYPDTSSSTDIIYRLKNLKPLIKAIEDFAKIANIKDIYSSKHGGPAWHLDQRLASVGIGQYVYSNGHKHLAYQTNRTCITVHGWKHYWINREKCIESVHFGSYRTWHGSTWTRAKSVLSRFFGVNSTLLDFVDKYRIGFISLLQNP